MACESESYESIFNEPSAKEYTCISSSTLSPSNNITDILVTAKSTTLSSNEDSTTTAAVNEKQCRICFCSESDSSNAADSWISPCKCNGSMKFVHRNCFEYWIKMAPIDQKVKCEFCGFVYERELHLRSLKDWTFPSFRVLWQFGIDILSTFNTVIGIWQVFDGKNFIVWLIMNSVYWKQYTYPRIKSRRIIYDVLEASILDAKIASLNH